MLYGSWNMDLVGQWANRLGWISGEFRVKRDGLARVIYSIRHASCRGCRQRSYWDAWICHGQNKMAGYDCRAYSCFELDCVYSHVGNNLRQYGNYASIGVELHYVRVRQARKR